MQVSALMFQIMFVKIKCSIVIQHNRYTLAKIKQHAYSDLHIHLYVCVCKD